MSLKAILFAICFFACCCAAPFIPMVGIVGYVLHYNLGPENQWWAASLNDYGIRYSLTLALLVAIGIVLNWGKLRFGKSLLFRQEKLLLLFLAIVWLSVFVGEKTVGRYTYVDHPSVKMTKLVILVLMITHVVTNIRNLDIFIWALIVGALFLGLEAWDTPRRAFIGGRLESVGGTDFHEANRLAGYLAAIMPILGIKFIRTNWPGKILCAVTGAFALNTIVLCRSRSALVGLVAGGLVLSVLTPRRYRLKIIICLIIAGCGFTYLMDPQFVNRSQTIFRSEEDRDRSAQSRIEIWKGGIKMIKSNPMGVGAGNFTMNIGKYVPQHTSRDAHSTIIRCGCELGLLGLAVLGLLIVNALLMYKRIIQQANKMPDKQRTCFQWTGCALGASLVALLAFGLWGSLVYFEAYWWFLLMPVCLQRCMDNVTADLSITQTVKEQKKIHEDKTGPPFRRKKVVHKVQHR